MARREERRNLDRLVVWVICVIGIGGWWWGETQSWDNCVERDNEEDEGIWRASQSSTFKTFGVVGGRIARARERDYRNTSKCKLFKECSWVLPETMR